MNDEIYGALHNLGLAKQSLEKALCALAHCNGWGKDQIVNIAVDYLTEANARFLYQVEKHLSRYIGKEDVGCPTGESAPDAESV